MVGSGASALKRFRSLQLGGMSLPDYGFYILCATAIVLLATQAVLHPADVAQILVFGVTQAAIYALGAAGDTMVYGIIELINFAHGDGLPAGTDVVADILGL